MASSTLLAPEVSLQLTFPLGKMLCLPLIMAYGCILWVLPNDVWHLTITCHLASKQKSILRIDTTPACSRSLKFEVEEIASLVALQEECVSFTWSFLDDLSDSKTFFCPRSHGEVCWS